MANDNRWKQGGPVPWSASPSRGSTADDVKARLNADEYVIPRDVVQATGPAFWAKQVAKVRGSGPVADALYAPTRKGTQYFDEGGESGDSDGTSAAAAAAGYGMGSGIGGPGSAGEAAGFGASTAGTGSFGEGFGNSDGTTG